MGALSRRGFLKYLGHGAAALGMAVGGAQRRWAQKPDKVSSGKGAAGVKDTKGKYQIFTPGKYLDWEKDIIEQRYQMAEKALEKGADALSGNMHGGPPPEGWDLGGGPDGGPLGKGRGLSESEETEKIVFKELTAERSDFHHFGVYATDRLINPKGELAG